MCSVALHLVLLFILILRRIKFSIKTFNYYNLVLYIYMYPNIHNLYYLCIVAVRSLLLYSLFQVMVGYDYVENNPQLLQLKFSLLVHPSTISSTGFLLLVLLDVVIPKSFFFSSVNCSTSRFCFSNHCFVVVSVRRKLLFPSEMSNCFVFFST